MSTFSAPPCGPGSKWLSESEMNQCEHVKSNSWLDDSQESAIPSETADCYDFPFSTSPVWPSKTGKLLRLQGPTV